MDLFLFLLSTVALALTWHRCNIAGNLIVPAYSSLTQQLAAGEIGDKTRWVIGAVTNQMRSQTTPASYTEQPHGRSIADVHAVAQPYPGVRVKMGLGTSYNRPGGNVTGVIPISQIHGLGADS
jgi:hypothetical protein